MFIFKNANETLNMLYLFITNYDQYSASVFSGNQKSLKEEH